MFGKLRQWPAILLLVIELPALNRTTMKATNVALTLLKLAALRFRRHPGSLVDFAFSFKALAPIQIPSELLRFANIVAKLKPRSILEIGTARGCTLCVLSRLAQFDAVIVSVDLPGGRFGGVYGPVSKLLYLCCGKYFQAMHLIHGDSHCPQTLQRVKECWPDFDLIFIDGDHTYEGVKQDFENYSPMLSKGGIIAFQDIAEHPAESGCNVSRFWNEIKGQYRHDEIIADPSQGWAGIGILHP